MQSPSPLCNPSTPEWARANNSRNISMIKSLANQPTNVFPFISADLKKGQK